MPSMIMTWLGRLLFGWNRITMYTVGILGVILALLGARLSIRRGAKKDIEARLQEQGYEKIKRTNQALADAARVPVDEWLRDNGLLRD